jgi:hypothetical protein
MMVFPTHPLRTVVDTSGASPKRGEEGLDKAE